GRPSSLHVRTVRTLGLTQMPAEPTCTGLSRLLPELRNETRSVNTAARIAPLRCPPVPSRRSVVGPIHERRPLADALCRREADSRSWRKSCAADRNRTPPG